MPLPPGDWRRKRSDALWVAEFPRLQIILDTDDLYGGVDIGKRSVTLVVSAPVMIEDGFAEDARNHTCRPLFGESA
jgi:hypothetical protein